jgi:predicted negative regulator of RcsB-dependent stress response
MSDPNDLAPSSSYSDPFYDRLDAVSRFLRRYWLFAALAVILTVVIAIVVNKVLARHPEAAGAAAFLHAQDLAQEAQQDRAKAVAAYEAVLGDPGATPYFKARAALEQTHLHLAGGDAGAARASVTKASDQIAAANDTELSATVRLSVAAVALQANELDAALTAFAEAERLAGPRLPAVQIEAILGQARVLERQAKTSEAIAQLEPLIARSDVGAEGILTVAKARYWRLKRVAAEAALPAAAAPAAPAAPEPAAVAPAVAEPVATPSVPAGEPGAAK